MRLLPTPFSPIGTQAEGQTVLHLQVGANPRLFITQPSRLQSPAVGSLKQGAARGWSSSTLGPVPRWNSLAGLITFSGAGPPRLSACPVAAGPDPASWQCGCHLLEPGFRVTWEPLPPAPGTALLDPRVRWCSLVPRGWDSVGDRAISSGMRRVWHPFPSGPSQGQIVESLSQAKVAPPLECGSTQAWRAATGVGSGGCGPPTAPPPDVCLTPIGRPAPGLPV